MNHRYDLFRARREHLNLTFGDVNRLCGLAKGTIIAAESPEGNPHASTLTVLSQCYGLDPTLSLNFKLKPNSRAFRLAVTNGAG